ncbi:hypothetical protein [Intestinirhabdus alba]|jgi:hypothetical protein|uniref:Uncharacterized protein n=1 Tax=Intestinirhabdus alba TaxID=2899544 RepID=A0A6L6IKZ0_9ENTR|nr:hypothetical protein [Intestinirhabdus alba]MTH45383.1 hypothetical protein [Intestinirhabdus alba]
MKTFKGTPGPWSLDEFDSVVHENSNVLGRKELVRVSGVSLPRRVTEEYTANTRLVSAAPELLEALQLFLDAQILPEYHQGVARAAISKALGEE